MSVDKIVSIMDKPLITVITPVFQRRDTLLCSVESVLEQTYPSIQYILVDDGPNSIDDASIRCFIHSRNKGNIKETILLHNKSNEGTVRSLNIAIEHAKGDYIFNLADDDCFYDEEVLSDWVDEFIRTGASILTARRAIYDQNLTDFIKIEPSNEQSEFISNATAKELFNEIAGANTIFGCATAKTKELLIKTGGYDENYRIIEDYSSNVQLLRKGYRIQFFDRIVVKYRYGGISAGSEITTRYLNESKRLFKQEILPYVDDKVLARNKFNSWRREVKRLSFQKEFDRKCLNEYSYLQKTCMYIAFFVKKPVLTFNLIIRKLKMKLRLKKEQL